jgi:hypothetical protein
MEVGALVLILVAYPRLVKGKQPFAPTEYRF